MSYKLTVQYKGGAGNIATRDTMVEILDRLRNIALLADQGSVMIKHIRITQETTK